MRHPLPSLRHHKPTGKAVVTLKDIATGRCRDIYLGQFGTPESSIEYDRVIREYLAGGRVVERPARQAVAEAAPPAPGKATVTDVVRSFYKVVKARYGGRMTGHVYSVRSGLRMARSLFGVLPAADFGPLALAQVRDTMAAKGWKRKTVNVRMAFIVAAFRHAVAQQMVSVTTWQALTAVPRLRRNEAGVIEGKKIGPVPLAHVEAVKPCLSPQIVALIDLQLLTGARGGELCIMRPCDMTTTGKVWEFRPQEHKGKHLDHTRVIYCGPRAQAIIKSFMAGRALDAYLFDPREGNAARKAAHASKGKPRRPDQKANHVATSRRIGDHYTAGSYRKAIERACITAGVPDWHPHQLRHTAATELRRQFGLEAASLMLGHASGAITDAVYAERDAGKAHAIALKVG